MNMRRRRFEEQPREEIPGGDDPVLILAINGSPNRSGNTATLLQAVLDAAAEEGVEGKLIQVMDAVKKQKMPFCVACSSPCKEACHDKDAGLKEACDALESAAAVVLGSPVYFGTVSAQLKALWDKTRAVRGRKSLVGKPAAAVSVEATAEKTRLVRSTPRNSASMRDSLQFAKTLLTRGAAISTNADKEP